MASTNPTAVAGSLIAGAVLGASSIMGVVTSQTGGPDQSPGDAQNPSLTYASE
jgi:hypothetical protein